MTLLAKMQGLCSAFLLTALTARYAVAEPMELSPLEQSLVAETLETRKLELDPAPEGKWIESIEVRRVEVFDERDPVPDLLNVFHTTSREAVIRHEFLFEVGDRYSQAKADEIARNLRAHPQLSVVLVVTARGSAPDRVRVIVITKDVWSIRLNWNVQSANGHINYLLLNPSETNAVGAHALVGGLLVLDPGAVSTGLQFAHRPLGTHIQGSADASLVWNRSTGAEEGSYGDLRYGLPLYALDTRWAWGTSFLWRYDVSRRFVDVSLARYDAKVTPGNDGIPIQFHRDRLYGGYQLTRSFGRRFKCDLSLGAEADRRVYRPFELSAYDPRAALEFVNNQLPVSDQRISPFAQLHAHRSDFDSRLEIETLGLQEDYQRGYDLLLRAYPASTHVGSSRDLIGTEAALSYTFPLGDGLVLPLVGSRLEYAAHSRDYALALAQLRAVSPRTGLGRFVLDGLVLDRFHNYLNRRNILGGEGRLRGYPVGAFAGADQVSLNAEFRTRSVDIWSAQVGAGLFYDLGDAADRVRDFRVKQSVGAGLRVLFPELDRLIFRLDWGFPLTPGYRVPLGAVFVAFGQAFDVPAVPVPNVTTALLEGSSLLE
ncbi:MAG TPA: hypothetical protein VGM29_17775 [Polyangiaceae bacterium]